MHFAFPVDNRMKIKESEDVDKILDFSKEVKKSVEHESNIDTNYSRCILKSLYFVCIA